MTHKERLIFKIFATVIMILLIVSLLNDNLFILAPLIGFTKAVFLPFIITGALFYLCRPLMQWMHSKKIPLSIAILLIYVGIGSLLYGLYLLIGPTIHQQFEDFVNQFPDMVSTAMSGLESLRGAIPQTVRDALPKLDGSSLSSISQYAGSITDSVINTFSWIGSAIIAVGLVPFTLFYVLKDSKKFTPRMLSLVPSNYRGRLSKLLKDLDRTVSSFILGQATVSVCVGVLLLIGYLIIGLDYALVLALFGLLLNVVPFLGPIAATLPALLVALFQDPILALYVIIVSVIAQQIEGNLISPQVMGHTLNIHPLTIIVLLLAAFTVFGILGIIFAIPAYAIAKVIAQHSMKLYRAEKDS